MAGLVEEYGVRLLGPRNARNIPTMKFIVRDCDARGPAGTALGASVEVVPRPGWTAAPATAVRSRHGRFPTYRLSQDDIEAFVTEEGVECERLLQALTMMHR